MPRAAPLLMCALAVSLGVTLLASCRSPTQLRIDVTTDVPCDTVRGASIAVGTIDQLEAKTPSAWRATCEGGRIGALVIVPSGAKNQAIAFRVVAGVNRAPDDCKPPDYGPGCIVARRALEFLPHTSLEVPVLMRRECDGIVCPSDQTCVKGGVCVSANIPDPSTCATPEGCDETVLTSPDGGAPDGTTNEGGTREGGDSSVTVTSKVSCGPLQACALRPDGRVFCWGQNGAGHLARDPDGGVPNGFSATPLQIPLGTPALDIGVGDLNACALVANGDVLCWGDNSQLESGQADGGAYVTPSKVRGLANVAGVQVGEWVACARLAGGTIACWGDNQSGEFAAGNMPMVSASAVDVRLPGGIVALAMGSRTLCALRDGGAVQCWGSSFQGETSSPSLSPDPVIVAGIPPARAIAIGSFHSCALAFDGRVFCWGSPQDGALGPSIPADAGPHPTPVEVALPTAVAITAGQATACATTADAGILCWGEGVATPTATDPSIASLRDICLGLSYGCGRRADGAILCWGQNFLGELGNGDTDPRTVATPVALPP